MPTPRFEPRLLVICDLEIVVALVRLISNRYIFADEALRCVWGSSPTKGLGGMALMGFILIAQKFIVVKKTAISISDNK